MIQVLIADDHAIVRRGLRQIIAETADLNVIAEVASAQETLIAADEKRADVLVLDLCMPDRNGFDILRELRHKTPKLAVLILSVHPEHQFAIRTLKAGAAGYLTKESAPDELVTAIRKVASGGRYISSGMADLLATHVTIPSSSYPHEKLSDREFQVLRMIAAGHQTGEIASTLMLSVKTVSTYRTRILEKMQLRTSAEIIRYAFDHQLVDQAPPYSV
jgi:DNA-binding NarL/FixJ family response regulator